MSYYKDLNKSLNQLVQSLDSKIKAFLGKRLDSVVSDFLEDLTLSFGRLLSDKTIRKYAMRTVEFQDRQLKDQIQKAISLDVFFDDTKLEKLIKTFVSENRELITSIPTELIKDLEPIVLNAATEGVRHEAIAKQLQERYGVAQSRASVIARDQIGKVYSEVNLARQEELGVKGYIWRTSNDDRVRREHSAREGKSFLWSEPPFDGHPGQPILCRCIAQPDFNTIE